MPWNVERAAQWIPGALLSRHFTKDRIWLRQSNFSSQLHKANRLSVTTTAVTPWSEMFTHSWHTTVVNHLYPPFAEIPCVCNLIDEPGRRTHLGPHQTPGRERKGCQKTPKASCWGTQEKREDSKGQATVERSSMLYRVFNCSLGRRSRRCIRTKTANGGSSGANWRRRRKTLRRQETLTDYSKPIAKSSSVDVHVSCKKQLRYRNCILEKIRSRERSANVGKDQSNIDPLQWVQTFEKQAPPKLLALREKDAKRKRDYRARVPDLQTRIAEAISKT